MWTGVKTNEHATARRSCYLPAARTQSGSSPSCRCGSPDTMIATLRRGRHRHNTGDPTRAVEQLSECCECGCDNGQPSSTPRTEHENTHRVLELHEDDGGQSRVLPRGRVKEVERGRPSDHDDTGCANDDYTHAPSFIASASTPPHTPSRRTVTKTLPAQQVPWSTAITARQTSRAPHGSSHKTWPNAVRANNCAKA